jgi:hypothetical protein
LEKCDREMSWPIFNVLFHRMSVKYRGKPQNISVRKFGLQIIILGYLAMIFKCSTLLCFVYISLTIPSTQLYTCSIKGVFILTHYMFRSYFSVIFMWYTNLKINDLNCHAKQSNRTWWVPCS